MFRKVLVANRSTVAARIIRALREMNIQSVAVYSEADAGAPYLYMADEAFELGPPPASQSYLNQDRLLDIISKSGVDGLHPGYGFLSENHEFAARVEQEGVKFIGPSPTWIKTMGLKTEARALFSSQGLAIGGASGPLKTDANIFREIENMGCPLLVKPAAGGGGIGMYPIENCDDKRKILEIIEQARSTAQSYFGNGEIYLEKLIEKPRHIEFQIIGDRHGRATHLFERDCSVQRRHQKVIEETRAPNVPVEILDKQASAIADVMQSLGYDNVGTVEMMMAPNGSFSFLEVNTRLQVEHGITEEITGVDIVKAMIKVAAGEKLADILPEKIEPRGHSMAARIYAEDPERFLPSPGALDVFRPPAAPRFRVETGYVEGMAVTPYYDPMLARIIVRGRDRKAATDLLIEGLEMFEIAGVKSNIPALIKILRSEDFQSGLVNTGLMETLFPNMRVIHKR